MQGTAGRSVRQVLFSYTPCIGFLQGVFLYVAQEPGLRLRPDRIWIGNSDRVLFGVGLFLFFRRVWDHCFGMLVCKEKIVGIYLSFDEYNSVDKLDKE